MNLVFLPVGEFSFSIYWALIIFRACFFIPEDGGGMRMKMPEGSRPRMTSGSSIAEDAVDQLQASEKLIAGKFLVAPRVVAVKTTSITIVSCNFYIYLNLLGIV